MEVLDTLFRVAWEILDIPITVGTFTFSFAQGLVFDAAVGCAAFFLGVLFGG